MKHFSLQWAKRQSWRLGGLPKPFPGQYPTRIYWVSGNKSYFGKPIKSRVEEFLSQALDTDLFVEFDRSSAVLYKRAGEVHHGRLFDFYYHWQRADYALTHLRVPLYRKRIAGYTVLSPYATLKSEYVTEWRSFAGNLLNRNLAKKTDEKVIKSPGRAREATALEEVIASASLPPSERWIYGTVSSPNDGVIVDRVPLSTATATPTPSADPRTAPRTLRSWTDYVNETIQRRRNSRGQ